MPSSDLKIGIALGGGGAKGMAHVGILKVFEKYGIKISAITGASAGAVIGGAYALGLSIDEITKRCKKFNESKILRITNFHLFSEGLIKSDDIISGLKDLVGEATFDDLKIPFKAVAVNLESGKEVVISKGKMWEAMRASSAIPGIFSPHFMDGQYLVDGGLLNNVPVNHLREGNDLDLVIGVDFGQLTSKQYISAIIWERYYKKEKTVKPMDQLRQLRINSTMMVHILLRSIDIIQRETQRFRYEEANPDIIINPNLENISLLQFEKYKEAMAIGEKEAERIMPQLLELIEQKKKM